MFAVETLLRRLRNEESGQALVCFALFFTALAAMAGLVVDFGVLAGQRLFDQNGADAAAAAVARQLAASVADNPTGGIYFAVADDDLYRLARQYAGLDPATSAATATGVNRAAGVLGRTNLAVTLEYWDGSRWCYSPAGPAPLAPPGEPDCTATAFLATYPPLPAADQYYRVRVTLHSATATLFPHAGGTGEPACLRPGGASGALTCAQAVYVVGGPCPPCTVALQQ